MTLRLVWRQLLVAGLLVLMAGSLTAKNSWSASTGRSRSHASSTPKAHSSSRSSSRANQKCATCERDSRGRIERSSGAKREFQRGSPCPSTGKRSGACPGYVIDHVTPLKRGGADAPSNVQWQTRDAAKAKDKIE
ncbi:MAG TPA: hypothetical protein VF146_05855 [Bryobacteraceae bacterium]